MDRLRSDRLAATAAVLFIAACVPGLAVDRAEGGAGSGSGAGRGEDVGTVRDVEGAGDATVATAGSERGGSAGFGPDFPLDDAALAPHFEDGALATARDLLEAGRPEAALEALASVSSSDEAPDASDDEASDDALGPSSPQRLFLEGRVLAAAKRPAQAAAKLEAAGDAYAALSQSGMAAFARCLAAQEHAAANAIDASVRLLTACAESPVPYEEPRISLASLQSQAGDVDEALALLRPWLGENPSAEALVTAARLSEEAGRADDARDFLLRAWTQDPTSPFATQARSQLDALATKQKAAVILPSHRLDRAERLYDLGDVRGSREQLKAAKIAPVCTGAACTPRSCGVDAPSPSRSPSLSPSPGEGGDAVAATGTTASNTTAPATAAAPVIKPFRLAHLVDPELSREERPLPSCAVEVVEDPADPLSCRAAFLDGKLLRRARQHTRAMGVLRPVYERCADPSLRVRALFLAQASASAVRHDDAVGLAWVLSLQFPRSSLADDALVTASNVARRAGDRVTERALLRRIESAHPRGDNRGEALFRLFWSYREDGFPEFGLRSLAVLEAEHDVDAGGIGADAERGRYWWGRTVALEAAPEDRAAGFEKLAVLARERPLTYYGLLARSFLAEHAPERLDAPPAPATANDTVALRPGPLAADPALRAGVELLRLGLAEDARRALTSIDLSRLDRSDPRAREAHVLVAGLIARAGDLREAHAIVRRDLPAWIRTGDGPLSVHASRLAYPLAYRELIARHAGSHGVQADFVQGLMREESALDPKALSPVGARGLTQLMPATARQVAASLGIRKLNLEALWEPDTNIRLGSTYLGRMLRKFGHPAIAAAAYNAGPTAVSRWLAERGDKPLDEFVEEIPYAETKGYVKRVLRSYATYRYLYGEPEERLLRVSLSLRDEGTSSRK